MDKQKGKHFSFIIPQPVEEVKARLASYNERRKFGFRGFQYLTAVYIQQQQNTSSWNVEILRYPYGGPLLPLKIRFAGTISYKTLESTVFEGQFIVNNRLYRRVINIILFCIITFFVSRFTGSSTIMFIVFMVVLAFTLSAIIEWIIQNILLGQNRMKMLTIIREFAPDDVIR